MEIVTSAGMSTEKISMANLLNRFRIDAITFPVNLISADLEVGPSRETYQRYAKLTHRSSRTAKENCDER